MRLRLLFLVLAVSFEARATLTSKTGLSGFPGSPDLTFMNISALTVGSSGDFSLAGGVNLYINTPTGAENFNSPGGQHIVGTNPSGEGIVKGAKSGAYAPPVTDAGGDTWAGNYLSTGYGEIVFTFSQPIFGFALLWGSVDATNEVDFLSGGKVVGGVPVLGTTVVGTVLGTAIAPGASGSQTFGGSFYTIINSTVGFNQIVLTSNALSFESADFNIVTPEPGSVALTLLGIAIVGVRLIGHANHARSRR